jgi:hypothetical protein
MRLGFQYETDGTGNSFCGFNNFLFCFPGADKYPFLFLVVQYRQPLSTLISSMCPSSTSTHVLLVHMVSGSIFFDARDISVMSVRGDPVFRRGRSTG